VLFKGLASPAIIFLLSTVAYGLTDFPVTTSADWHLEPDISGNTVVWRSGVIESAIGGRTLPGAEFSISQAAGTQSLPAVSGTWAVWMDNAGSAIRAKNLSGGSESVVTTGVIDTLSAPATSGGKAVWAAPDAGSVYNIYYKDLAGGTAQAVSASTAYGQGFPVISGNNVAWIEDRSATGGTIGIYATTLGSGTVYTVAADTGWTHLAIDGSVVVWQDGRNGNAQIYGRNFVSGNEFAVSANAAEQKNPDVSRNLVVWQDNRNGNWDIFGLDLATGLEFAVTTNAANKTYPAIDGRTVVWEDPRNDPVTEATAIYGATIPGAAALRWTGAADNKWGNGQAVNWSAGPATLRFQDGDHVAFDSAGSYSQPINITGAVFPASVLVGNQTGTVTIGGSGAIAGSCKMTKMEAGTLVLSGAHSYSGGTEVSGGTLLVENTADSATGSGAVTVTAATLGGTGFINGPVTLLDDATLTSTATLTINNTLTVKGLANRLSSGTIVTIGDVTIDPGAVFIINGTLGGEEGYLIVRGMLMGKGTINKTCILDGGTLSPGAPSTIQSWPQVSVAAAPRNFEFEIGAAGPNYASPSNSINDLVRLTDGATPFANEAGGPAALTADTVIDVYFLSDDPALGAYRAEFFAASDFTDAVAGATYQYWRLDPRGGRYHNGNFFSPLDSSLVDWSVVRETATFGGTPASGYITEFTVVPEPATLALVGLAGLAMIARRRAGPDRRGRRESGQGRRQA
jgi:beta propeller repeat protein/autotransporter-associated beta strand protein